jgi:uncharacterized membrane-anchored protein
MRAITQQESSIAQALARGATSFVEYTGPARLDRRTKRLVHRLKPGDIAVIDHADLDRVSAEELVESGVRVVVNVAASQTGRFPKPGPLLLLRSGVRLIEMPGAPLFEELSEGDVVTIRGATLFRDGVRVGAGRTVEAVELELALAEQRSRVTESLEAFVENTLLHLREEGRILAEGIDFPPLRTRFRDRHALVVARGPGHKRDLRIVRPYIRGFDPVLVGVDGGADALREAGYRPDVIVGDMDSVSEGALRSGAELLVQAYADGRAPGAERLEQLGVPYATVRAPGLSEDLALLLAYEKGARLLVAVGTHFNLIDFLERDRAGMSSTFVTRLKVGEILVDARGISRLVSRRVGLWPLIAFTLGAVGAVVVAVAADPGIRRLIGLLSERVRDLVGLG